VWEAVSSGRVSDLTALVPHTWHDLSIPLAVTITTLGYGFLLPYLYAREEHTRRKAFLVISMVANLAILGFFKYCDFFIHSFNSMVAQIGLGHLTSPTLNILLPAGISFYTFQAMSYTIDIYRNEVEPTESFRDFALFVCFFPHLVAGPIMRAHTLLPQVTQVRTRQAGDMVEGLQLVLIGLFKKIVIADNMAVLANSIFYQVADGNASALSGGEVLVGIYAFAFQIYGDFSGYSSIARGISKWLGFDLAVNFHLPYLAVSPSDFWRRWHISLSTWLRDYLYIPLGGNRLGTFNTYRNLLVTMILGGLWHGASWTFVAWGTYHGLILCAFRALRISDTFTLSTWKERAVWLCRVVMMFQLTCLGWLLFRADSLSTVFTMLGQIAADFRWPAIAVSGGALVVLFGVLPFLFEWMTEGEHRLDRLSRLPALAQGTVYALLIALTVILHSGSVHEFIYFQF
jgi:alginate O-acetyltransferase complex protein AlgI